MTKKQQARARAELREAARFFPAVATLLAAVAKLAGPTEEITDSQWESLKLGREAHNLAGRR